MAAEHLAERVQIAQAALHGWASLSAGARARVLARAADELLSAGAALVEARLRDEEPVELCPHEVLAHEVASLAVLARRAARALSREGGVYEAERAGLGASRGLEVEPTEGELVGCVTSGYDGLVGAFGPACGALAAGHAALVFAGVRGHAAAGRALSLARGCFTRAGVPSGVLAVVEAPWARARDEAATIDVRRAVSVLHREGFSRWACAGGVEFARPVAAEASQALVPSVVWAEGPGVAVVTAGAAITRSAEAIARGAFALGGAGSLSLRVAYVERRALDALCDALGLELKARYPKPRALHGAHADAFAEALNLVRGSGGRLVAGAFSDELEGVAYAGATVVRMPGVLTDEVRAALCALRGPLLALVPVEDARESYARVLRLDPRPGVAAIFSGPDESAARSLARGVGASCTLLDDAPYTRVGDAPLVLTRPALGDSGASDPLYGSLSAPRSYARASWRDARIPYPTATGWKTTLRAMQLAEGAAGLLGSVRDPY